METKMTKNISVKWFKYVPKFDSIHIIGQKTFYESEKIIKELNKIERNVKYRLPTLDELKWMTFNKEKLGIYDCHCWYSDYVIFSDSDSVNGIFRFSDGGDSNDNKNYSNTLIVVSENLED
jgi:hypothetical protein